MPRLDPSSAVERFCLAEQLERVVEPPLALREIRLEAEHGRLREHGVVLGDALERARESPRS